MFNRTPTLLAFTGTQQRISPRVPGMPSTIEPTNSPMPGPSRTPGPSPTTPGRIRNEPGHAPTSVPQPPVREYPPGSRDPHAPGVPPPDRIP